MEVEITSGLPEEQSQQPLEITADFTFSEGTVENEVENPEGGFVMELPNTDNVVIPNTETQQQEDKQEPNTEEQSEADKDITQEQKQEEESEEEFETLELNEDLAIEFLANSKGMTVEEFKDSLTPKQKKQYDPYVEKFQEFIDKTGNTDPKAFEATQKDWTTESQEVVLKELLRKENPDLEPEDIDFLYEDKYVFDDEIDSEREIKLKQIRAKSDLKEAYSYLDKQKEEFMVNRGSEDHIPEEYRDAKTSIEQILKQQEDYNLLIEESRKDFSSKAEKLFTPEFEGFKFKVENEDKSTDEFVYKPDDVQEAQKWHSSLDNLNSKFFDKNNKVINDDYYAIAEIARIGLDKFVKHIVNSSKATQLEKQDKLSKNIQPDNIKTQPSAGASGYTFFVDQP